MVSMDIKRSQIVDIVVVELTSGTDALTDEEAAELADAIGDRAVRELRCVFDDRTESVDDEPVIED